VITPAGAMPEAPGKGRVGFWYYELSRHRTTSLNDFCGFTIWTDRSRFEIGLENIDLVVILAPVLLNVTKFAFKTPLRRTRTSWLTSTFLLMLFGVVLLKILELLPDLLTSMVFRWMVLEATNKLI
jgi:hypothetical protein